LINSGFSLRDPESFSKRFYKLFNGALGVPKDATVKEIEVDLTEEDDDDDDKKKKEESTKPPEGSQPEGTPSEGSSPDDTVKAEATPETKTESKKSDLWKYFFE